MRRRMTLLWEQGGAVERREVTLRYGSEAHDSVTDDSGLLELVYPRPFVEEVTVDGVTVKQNWDIGEEAELGDVYVWRPAELWSSREHPQLRRLAITAENGDVLAGRDVTLSGSSERASGLTDRAGRVRLQFSGTFVTRVELDGVLVKENWDIGDAEDLGELLVARAGSTENDHEAELHSVRGRLYFSDGTQAFGDHEVVAEFGMLGAGGRYSSRDALGYCHDDGAFFIPTRDFMRGVFPKFWVDGNEARYAHRDPHEDFYTVIMPPKFGDKQGSVGGLVTGQVLDADDSPLADSKVSAQVAGSLFSGGGFFECRTDRNGRFVLRFEGAINLKQVLVDGSEPARVTVRRKGEEQEFENRNVRAGTFNLVLRRRRKLFGIF